MSALPWMPLYSGDLLADTLDLTGAEFGAYMLLIIAYWNNKGPLPDDERRLLQIARARANPRILLALIPRFFQRRDNTIVSQRIDKELIRAQQAYAGRAAGARSANAKRAASATQLQPQSEKKEPVANATGRGSRISPDWKPSDQDQKYAADKRLSPETIAAVGEQFKDHWLAKSGAGAVKRDWSATWRNWVKNHISFHGTGPWPRGNAGRSNGSRPGPASTVDVINGLIAQADLEQQNGAERMGRGDTRIYTAEHVGADSFGSFGGGENIIDADDAARMFEAAGRG